MRGKIENEADFNLDIKVAGVGAQGPDIFLFHRLLPPFTIYKALFGVSSKLHREKPEILFNAFSKYLKITENMDIAKSYIYGFILHYALDRNCHPYIYAIQNEITSQNKRIHPLAAHNTIEHAVDTYLLYNRKGVYPPSLFDPADTFTSEQSSIEEIGKLMAYVISEYQEKRVPKSEVERAVTDTAKVQTVLSDKNGGATRAAHMLETPLAPFTKNFKLSASIKPKDLDLANKYANIKNKPWTSPYDNLERNFSFDELFEKSKGDALELIRGFEAICREEKSGYEVTGNISFLTGLEVS